MHLLLTKNGSNVYTFMYQIGYMIQIVKIIYLYRSKYVRIPRSEITNPLLYFRLVVKTAVFHSIQAFLHILKQYSY